MMQLNRAKFMVNGGIGYVLKPPPMCKGSFNPFSDDPLPAYPKKQLILKIISGQQLPKPPDSMLGDRGEIIDPFVEVEIIGLPIDCCKEQTRVVDDNGFNPVWEETLSFTLHMAEVVLVRFLVWDHDPIGRDFIGQRTVAFSSLMPGYRHVYLEGLTEASIFVHVSVHDVYGKWSPLVLNPSFTIMHFLGSNKGHQLRGIRGLFNRSSKSSVDTNSGGLRKRSISDHLLRRTASAPAKGRKKTKMGLSESVASISDQKNGMGAEARAEGMSGKEGVVEKRFQPRVPLTHRPISMPLDRLMQGQLSICSPDKELHDIGSDSGIGGCPFNRPRSSSLDPFLESSFSFQTNISSPSMTYINRKKECDQSEEASYLVIGGREVSKEEDYANYQSKDSGVNKPNNISTRQERKCCVSPSWNSPMKSDKPETSSNSTTGTSAPSISASSSSNPSSLHPLSPISGNCNLKSPISLHDSTISRLIDAVSLDNEQDTCGSISALIGQFERTVEQNDSHTLSHDHTPFRQSNVRPTTPKDLRDADAGESTSSNSLGSSPAKVFQGSRKGHNVSWEDMNRKRAGSEKIEEAEESVYEEVYDPPALALVPEKEQGTSKRYIGSSVNNNQFQFHHDSAGNAFAEVETNVDEDPLDIMTRNGSQREGLISPTKRQAIYENHESTPNYYQQRQPSSHRYPQQQYPSHAFSQCLSPMNQPSYQLPNHQNNSQLHKPINCRASNPSPLHQNIFPGSQNNSNAFNNSRDFSSSSNQQMSYSGSQIPNRPHQDWLGYKQTEMEQTAIQCTAIWTMTALRPHQSLLKTPSHTAKAMYPTRPQSGTIDPKAPSPCKSKSLGDLTSEDISCNFQSKYHIISRSFITPNMRKQKRVGAMGEVTFQSQFCDPLTEQLRKLVSLEADDCDRDRPQPPQDVDDSPPPLTRRLSSRSQSRVRHINSRARERQQEALKPRAGVMINSTSSIGGVVLRNKPASHNPPANRHSTGSYIAGYLGQLEDRGLPEGACTSLRYGNGDHYGDRYYTDDSLPPGDANHSASEPEVYFLLRL
ncbi:1-phosphatidylinositol 45-bisphosphate phosphodiesterase eta-1 [Dissostichus eleginoides]|uniref:1-phosphatidylinositol 45-bisphosphate phosphodiesterase eta-1 n=1 Tax=Dissostichus eleginoides TaxID=100907 RepID=A0AAD9CJ97_DISEL|nr:1-phosphatidylinositol 45-bisphosphate phosphodiesterase eta-1 [Dissostichus eleginoides]